METVIGLEIHVQLKTETKLFCGCLADSAGPPNSRTCPVCLGMPGALPVPNKRAVELAIRAALAFHCAVHASSTFARKNYFYPDLPKGYQISQYDEPLASGGWLELEGRRIGLRRLHLEEDAAKLVHTEDGRTLVDFNRAGVPLIEIVTAPEIRSPKEARALLQAVRRTLRYIGVSDCDMEEGQLRCDANISLRQEGSRAGTRTEIKNLNSLKALEEALAYEEARQRALLEAGEEVEQQTLTWDAAAGRTIPIRSKEEAEDYRYFPEPDLPPLLIGSEWLDEIRRGLPELPEARRRRWRAEYGLPEYDIEVLTEEREIADYFEAVVRLYPRPKEVSNWMMTELLRLAKEGEIRLGPADFAQILRLVGEGKLNRAAGKGLLEEAFRTGRSPEELLAERDLLQISDAAELSGAVSAVLAENPQAVADYRGGREQALSFLLGQVMRKTEGKADPKLARALLLERLGPNRT
ncbi:MAG: Asp-tRNA(Asn)/Glu-tRNA(Gln) amidotransferase subunit GatB [Candidatus Acetothermia bacterium]|nr:Asp-tRNA(Asn)/Glu-tRNA(Gln) amidotransferase subunit GatB [Candidatus Acetothermia bacterium]MDH7505112.1 Asp-tRNA(Asn)/Glu-tRNA(Gln) amidotransferase subunit GatB [Candidatus Acetothermia bacterium]